MPYARMYGTEQCLLMSCVLSCLPVFLASSFVWLLVTVAIV